MSRIAHNSKTKDFRTLYKLELDRIKKDSNNTKDTKRCKDKIEDNNYREY